MAGTVYLIWSRAERKIVPTPETTYPDSATATSALRRIIGKQGNAKDVQSRVYDVIGPFNIS